MKKITLLFCALIMLIGQNTLFGQETLVPGRNTVTYISAKDEIVAHLYLPEDYVEGEKRPAIVVTRPASGVKEQTAGVYAEAMSKKGFITLAFDPRGFGESEGHPQLENPMRIIEDTRNSISYISSLEQVDPQNVFGIGICMGAGYAAYTAAFDARINAVAMISPYLAMQEEQLAIFQGSIEALRTTLQAPAAAARQNHYVTGEDLLLKPVPETEEEIQTSTPIAVGMRDYYLPGQPGGVPNWRNELSIMSMMPMFSFAIYNFAFMFDAVPVYMAYGTEAVSTPGAKRFYDMINGPKELKEIEGAGHFDLYWKPEHVDPISEGIETFFGKYMKKGTLSTESNIMQGVNDKKSSSLSIYPNPSSESVSVTMQNANGLINVTVVSSGGRVMLQQDIQNGEALDINSLEAGTYVVKVKSGTAYSTEKLLIEK